MIEIFIASDYFIIQDFPFGCVGCDMKIYLSSVPDSSWKRSMLSHALARAATRRHDIYGVPFDCVQCVVM